MAIIKSLADTDYYKFTMMQAIFHQHSSALGESVFKWRNWDKMELTIPIEEFCEHINEELDALCILKFREDELSYIGNPAYIRSDFIDYLRLFKLNRSHITAYTTKVGDRMDINIRINGSWLNTTLFEVPVLAIVSELYTKYTPTTEFIWQREARKKLKDKVSWLLSNLHKDQKFYFSDFGTRRRASFKHQGEVLEYLIKHCPENLVGTSNVYYANKYNLKMIGTVAHEFFQAHQQLNTRLVDSQKAALQSWADEYRGELGIALSDTLGFDAFLCDFDRYFALLFDGCRHDSGDPVLWCQKLIDHYKYLRIDPITKMAVFSDGLTFETAINLFNLFNRYIQTSFGIGTYLTNDCGFLAPQVVIKLVQVNGSPVAKISDSAGKGMCEDPSFLRYFKEIIEKKVAKQRGAF